MGVNKSGRLFPTKRKNVSWISKELCMVEIALFRLLKSRAGKYSRELSHVKNCFGLMDYCLINFVNKGELFRLSAGTRLKRKNLSGTEIYQYKSGTVKFCYHYNSNRAGYLRHGDVLLT